MWGEGGGGSTVVNVAKIDCTIDFGLLSIRVRNSVVGEKKRFNSFNFVVTVYNAVSFFPV